MFRSRFMLLVFMGAILAGMGVSVISAGDSTPQWNIINIDKKNIQSCNGVGEPFYIEVQREYINTGGTNYRYESQMIQSGMMFYQVMSPPWDVVSGTDWAAFQSQDGVTPDQAFDPSEPIIILLILREENMTPIWYSYATLDACVDDTRALLSIVSDSQDPMLLQGSSEEESLTGEAGISVPNRGLIQINAANPQPVYATPNRNDPVRVDGGVPLLLPHDSNNDGFDTYVVTAFEVIDDLIWVSIFLGGDAFVWLPLSDVIPLTEVIATS